MKKRYELFEEELKYWIHDHETKKNFGNWDLDCLTDLLNEHVEKINELEKYKSKYTDCLDKQLERENATHNCLLQSKTILDNLKKENQQLKEEIKQLKFDCAMYKSANYLINDIGIDNAK